MVRNKLKQMVLLLATISLTNIADAVNQTGNNSNNSSGNNSYQSGNSSNAGSSSNSGSSGNSANAPISKDKVVLNFENADIQTVIKAISQLSGKNFVIDPRVKGTVNIVSDKPVSKSDSYKVLESALRMQGFATVEADGVIKVLPETDAKTYGMRTEAALDGGMLSKGQQGDQVITKIFVIQHGSAMQLANSLRPLIAPNNSISVYPNSNALIVTDYSSNIARISKIINQLSEVNDGRVTQPVIITFQNAVAADVAQILQSYLNGGGTAPAGQGASNGNSDGPSATITVEASTNSIILYSPIKDKLDELKALAQKVDSNVGSVNNNLHVVYLKNADAAHVADVLRSVVNQQENPDLTPSSGLAKFTSEPTSTFGSTGSSGAGGAGGGGGGTSSASRSTSTNANRGNTNNANANQKDQPKILVQAEPTTNSLIIQAPQAVYKNLRMIIDMLDVRRAQVMVEAMIADVNTTEQGAFGIQWLVGGGNNNAGVIALTNYGSAGVNGGGSSALSSLANSVAGAAAGSSGGQTGSTGISVPNEVYVGLVTGTTTIGGQTIPTLGALADMITSNSVGNVLSRPTMITLDNEEARIMVGQNIGIPNGSYQNTAAQAGNLVTTITRQDLGTVLQIKPLITQNGAIQMDIYQENSALDANQPVNQNNGPSFLKRNMRMTVLVDDGQIIALGGMTEDTITIQQNGIPGLSSIPYIGWLFSWQSRYHNKMNLVLFLRPVIIKNADGYKALTNQRYNYILGQENQVQAKGNIMLPSISPVTLDNQLPYSTQQVSGQSNPSLNLNKSISVVDLTNQGGNVSKSSPDAVKVTSEIVAPTVPTDSNNNQIQVVAPGGSTATPSAVSPSTTAPTGTTTPSAVPPTGQGQSSLKNSGATTTNTNQQSGSNTKLGALSPENDGS